MKAYLALNQGRSMAKAISLRVLQGNKISTAMGGTRLINGDAPNGKNQLLDTSSSGSSYWTTPAGP